MHQTIDVKNNSDNYPQILSVKNLAIDKNDVDPNHNQSSTPKSPKKAISLNETPKSSPRLFRKKKKEPQEQDGFKKDIKITEHLLSLNEVCAKYATDADKGLDEEEAARRLARDGINAFTPPKQTPEWVIFCKNLFGGFAILLWIASIGSFIAYSIEVVDMDLVLGSALAITVILTGIFSYYQQSSSTRVFKSFRNMVPQTTHVIRGGIKKPISVEKLVVGDLVYTQSGDRIPADLYLFKCDGMKVDNSALTGESDALARSPIAGHHDPLEAKNLAFFSTNCVDGNGFGIVVATGDRTVMGGIAKLISSINVLQTPISIEIGRFVKLISCLAVFMGTIIFIFTYLFSKSLFQAFIFMIGMIVGNVPEGILPMLTACMTLAAKKMSSKNCLVKHVEAVETLGSTSVICTDKTGTLTQNRMTVAHCWLGNTIHDLDQNPDKVKEVKDPMGTIFDLFTRCGRLCSRAEFLEEDSYVPVSKRACTGDASETAILRYMESITGSVKEYRDRYPKVAEKPFSSLFKYQFSIHKNTFGIDNKYNFFMVIKGAPEKIISLCSCILTPDGTSVPIDKNIIIEFEEAYRELGSLGERVIALADKEYPSDQYPDDYQFDIESDDFKLENLRFIGLISMIDPPRPAVPDAVAKCRRAGIKVIMVTGDHPITAQAIAKAVGIFTKSHRRSTVIRNPKIDQNRSGGGGRASVVIPGDELSNLNDEELRDILYHHHEIVFARTTPQQKLRIVENVQKLGQVVAVTGDGVNDSPALKKANIGVAMGITGSDVSKQAADMILLDDNFASIVVGVEEGRRIFDNLKKTIRYIMAGNITTLIPYILYVILGMPLAMGVIQVLLICLGTDFTPAISLAYEVAEKDIMNVPPRHPVKDKLVSRDLFLWCYSLVGIIECSAGYMSFFVAFMQHGFYPSQLVFVRETWEDSQANITNSYNEDYNYDDRMLLQRKAQSYYFVAIVVCQWINVGLSKTRRASIFQQGMKNMYVNCAIVFETLLAALFLYTPGFNTILQTISVDYWVWLIPLPFFMYIFVFEEVRKLIIRKYPDGFIAKEWLV